MSRLRKSLSPAELIRQSYQTLSPVQKRIADLILGEIETVCFLRLDEVSKKADVTTVTVIRFVKKLGYESYGAFKKELQNYVQTMIIPKRIVKAEIQNFRLAFSIPFSTPNRTTAAVNST